MEEMNICDIKNSTPKKQSKRYDYNKKMGRIQFQCAVPIISALRP